MFACFRSPRPILFVGAHKTGASSVSLLIDIYYSGTGLQRPAEDSLDSKQRTRPLLLAIYMSHGAYSDPYLRPLACPTRITPVPGGRCF